MVREVTVRVRVRGFRGRELTLVTTLLDAEQFSESRFGPVFHRLTFDAAIRADLLTDYEIVVIGVTEAELRQWAEEARLVRWGGTSLSPLSAAFGRNQTGQCKL